MNGQMKSYKNYIESLNRVQEPKVPKAKIDMRGAIKYAQEKGVSVEDLSRKEKDSFIQYL